MTIAPVPAPSDAQNDGDWTLGADAVIPQRVSLSPAEIDMLLRPDLSDMDGGAPEHVDDKSLPDLTDLRSPETLARDIASAVSLSLRQACEVDAVALMERATRGDFASCAVEMADPGLVLLFGKEGAPVSAALVVSHSLANLFIDPACGGTGLAGQNTRQLTELDASILGALLSPVAAAFGDDYQLCHVEHRHRHAAALMPAREAIAADVAIAVGDDEASAKIVFIERTADETDTQGGQSSPDGLTAVLTARLARLSVPASRISSLKPGDTLLLGLPPDQPVDLLSGGRDGRLAAEGALGRKGEKIAVRISKRGPALKS